nr:ParB/RepB/Spo0J family partition protein [uncultured Caproiciproducens sp.]
MAKDKPNNPEEMTTGPVSETPAEKKTAPAVPSPEVGGEAPAPEPTVEEKAVLTQEGKKPIEPPAPSDIGGEHVPNPGDIVVPPDKINELMSEKKPSHRGRLPKADKAEQAPAPEKTEAEKSNQTPKREHKPRAEKQKPAAAKKAPVKEESPAPEPPQEPKEAPRKGETEQIVFLNLSELHAFKNHPFQVRDDDEMRAMVESVRDKGVTQPAIVRSREDGGFEIVSGHRRQKASELAGYADMPCIVRNLTDDEAITQMVEDNINQRENILPSERAKALKMQLEAIKRQGVRGDLSTSGQLGPKSENGQRSNAVVAERNKMTVKQVQRYIKLNDLVPDLMKMVDEKKISFTPAVEMSFIKPKNQRYIAVAIEGQQSAPSLSQAQRMRELDQKGMLNGDVIDGIMLEEKKEVDKVIISSQELSQYFGKEKTPREMKDTIIKLLDEWKGQQKDIAKPEKQTEQEK